MPGVGCSVSCPQDFWELWGSRHAGEAIEAWMKGLALPQTAWLLFFYSASPKGCVFGDIHKAPLKEAPAPSVVQASLSNKTK